MDAAVFALVGLVVGMGVQSQANVVGRLRAAVDAVVAFVRPAPVPPPQPVDLTEVTALLKQLVAMQTKPKED